LAVEPVVGLIELLLGLFEFFAELVNHTEQIAHGLHSITPGFVENLVKADDCRVSRSDFLTEFPENGWNASQVFQGTMPSASKMKVRFREELVHRDRCGAHDEFRQNGLAEFSFDPAEKGECIFAELATRWNAATEFIERRENAFNALVCKTNLSLLFRLFSCHGASSRFSAAHIIWFDSQPVKFPLW
jgi:hypothetical protein